MERAALFRRVRDGVAVLDPSVGADTMAVLGAMMSRAPDLGRKIDRVLADILTEEGIESWSYDAPPERIARFLLDNVAGYGHASIASMAKSIFIYLEGFGWPSAWLLEDFPLFDGQEVSTRAVKATQIPGRNGPGTVCRYAPDGLDELHAQWLAEYATAAANATTGNWKFDDSRVFLPGTIPTGVVITQDVRAIARHFDKIRALGGTFEQLADQGYAGLETLAPITTQSVGHRPRRPESSWRVGRVDHEVFDLTPNRAVRVRLHDADPGPDAWEAMLREIPARPGPSTYLDARWAHAPRFHIEIYCSVAVARDFHRHRPMMPWTLDVVYGEDGKIAAAPWYGVRERVGSHLWDATNTAFERLVGWGQDPETAIRRGLEALHALPFGTLVRLQAVASLPALLYMLELRANAPGANAEYRSQARSGLEQLCDLLPPAVVEAEQIDGVLRKSNKEETIR